MAAKQNSGNNKLAMTILKDRTFIVLIILLIFFSITADNFMSAGALLTVAKHVALYGILAIGMTYVIITGGIDLSVGSVAGLAGMIAGGLIQEGLTLKMFGVTLYFSLLGALMGMINGLVITKFNVAPFIATLGTMYIWRGFANIRSNGATFSELAGSEGLGNTGFEVFGRNLAGTAIPCGVLILALIAVAAGLVLKKTPFGWHVLSIGGNEKASKLSGIKVDRVKIWVYAFSGFCSAVVGIIATSQLVSATPKTGESWEMNAIAASYLAELPWQAVSARLAEPSSVRL